MLCLSCCVLGLVLSLWSLVWADDPRFATCGPGRVFAWTCDDEAEASVAPAPPPVAAPLLPPSLFTPQTIAPTAPPALLEGLNNPTATTAARYVDDQQARLAIITYFNSLVQEEYRRRGLGRPRP